jgi:hypothetical protein
MPFDAVFGFRFSVPGEAIQGAGCALRTKMAGGEARPTNFFII